MNLKCEKCDNTANITDIKLNVIKKEEKFEEDDWFLDLEFSYTDKLYIENYYALCPEHRPDKYTESLKKF